MFLPAELHISHSIKKIKTFFLNIKNLEVHLATSSYDSDIKDHSVYFWSAVSTRWEKASGTQKRLTFVWRPEKKKLRKKKKNERETFLLYLSEENMTNPPTPPKHLQPVPQVWSEQTGYDLMSTPGDPRKCFKRKQEFNEVKIPHKEVNAFNLIWKGLLAWFCVCLPAGCVTKPLLVLVPASMFNMYCLWAIEGIWSKTSHNIPPSLSTSVVFAFNTAKCPNFNRSSFLLLAVAPTLAKLCHVSLPILMASN